MGEWEHLFSNHYTTGSLVIIAYNLVGVYILTFKKKIVVNQIGSMICIDDIHLKVCVRRLFTINLSCLKKIFENLI